MMKKVIAAIAAVLMLTAGLTACGEKKDTAETTGKDTPAVETTVVVETTAEGISIEKDAEGNVLEVDKTGSVVSIKDKNGKEIPIKEYVKTHQTVVAGGSVPISAPEDDNSGDSSSKAQSSSSKSDASSSKSEGSSSKSESSSSKSESSSSKSESSSSKSESQSGKDDPESAPETIHFDEYELPII